MCEHDKIVREIEKNARNICKKIALDRHCKISAPKRERKKEEEQQEREEASETFERSMTASNGGRSGNLCSCSAKQTHESDVLQKRAQTESVCREGRTFTPAAPVRPYLTFGHGT
ncbi:hypothetical protein ALC56_07528 [Trachymyrmex septentrionalis]|uniref:Uncharacterized protein n=1 Tax=Trachymyrmex septentrionalis TaxID=34720 RepID=A0A195FCJ3_9HYME|nr:hypothetical protein ALC56_07528 [Trachymyrmex septentrionalis]